MGKRGRVIEGFKWEGERFLVSFATGEELVGDTGELSEDIQKRAMVHGVEQKLRDSVAGAQPGHAFGLMTKVWEALQAGQWSARREGQKKLPDWAAWMTAVGFSTGDIQKVAQLPEGDRERVIKELRDKLKLPKLSI